MDNFCARQGNPQEEIATRPIELAPNKMTFASYAEETAIQTAASATRAETGTGTRIQNVATTGIGTADFQRRG
jgi:hypothetical protein